MMTLTALLLVGCRSQSTLEKAMNLMDKSKNLRFVINAEVGSEKKQFEVWRSQPNRYRFVSKSFESCVNEKEGYIEFDHSEQLYASKPWLGRFFPGIDVFAPIEAKSSGIFGITSISSLGALKQWKNNGKKEGLNEWQIDSRTPEGVVSSFLRVDDEGKIMYWKTFNGVIYRVQSSDYNATFKDSDFTHQIPDGYSVSGVESEDSKFSLGETFKVDDLQRAADVASWKPSGYTLFCLLNPQESNNLKAEPWIQTKKEGYATVPIYQGESTNGFFDPKGVTASWSTSTPYFVLVNDQMKIMGIWAGFDPQGIVAFEKDIRQAIMDR